MNVARSKSAQDLRIADVLTVLAVARCRSVSVAAKERNVTPSQVSKAVQRIERALGQTLFVRRANSTVPSETGIARISELRQLADVAQRVLERQGVHPLAIAAPSFLCDAYGGALALAAAPRLVRLLELGMRSIRAHASDGLFQVALTSSRAQMPAVWTSVQAGALEQGLFTSPRVRRALGKRPKVSDLERIPFVQPVYASGAEVVAGDDGCPLARESRTPGHEASTIRSALDLAARSDQLAFGPVIVAAPWIARGELERVRVEGWDSVSPLYLHVHSDGVTGALMRKLMAAIAPESGVAVAEGAQVMSS